ADDEQTRDCFFTKPWYQCLLMKCAMSLCLFISWLAKFIRGKLAPAAQTGGLGETLLGVSPLGAAQKPQQPTWAAIRFIMLPAATDLLQTVLASAGLLWVSSSTYQMTRGSVIVFTSLISVKYFGKQLHAVHYVAIGIVCAAILLVGLAGSLGEGPGTGTAAQYCLGLLLIVLGQVVGALQFVLEELIMEKHYVSPTLLVGWEGLWGALYFVALVPILSSTPGPNELRGTLADASVVWHEDFYDSWLQLRNSHAIQDFSVVAGASLLVYNLVGNMVTKQLSAVMRSILESVRTLGVWVISLLLWYTFDDRASGEEWTNFSFLQLAGFALLVYGTIAYKEILPIPGISNRRQPLFDADAAAVLI
ncbi:hypothetical protein M885DRAFT_530847, partial [Pelagophyceae sp. CCMP2097]